MRFRPQAVLGTGAVALALGLGFGAASGLTGSPDEGGGTEPRLVSTTSADGRAAKVVGHLKDGSTYGYWYGDTPDVKRPDYTRVKLDDGEVGYLKVEEVWPAADPAMFESSDAGRALRAENMAKQIQPNSKGEVWAPAYAADAKTVIDKVLVYTVGDSPEK